MLKTSRDITALCAPRSAAFAPARFKTPFDGIAEPHRHGIRSLFRLTSVRNSHNKGVNVTFISNSNNKSDTMEQHRGTLILILGILGLVLCQLLGPFAWVMGKNDLEKMAAGQMDPEGEGMTKAGKICGMIATILIVVGLVIGVLAMVLGIGTAAMSGGLDIQPQ